jgi:hypothetical protein
MRFILYAFCHIFIHAYEIKRKCCEKEIFFIVQLLRTVNSHSPTYKLSNDMKFSRVLERCIKILQMCEKSLDYRDKAPGIDGGLRNYSHAYNNYN